MSRPAEQSLQHLCKIVNEWMQTCSSIYCWRVARADWLHGEDKAGCKPLKGCKHGGRAQGWYGSPLVAPCTAKVQAQGPSRESHHQQKVMGPEKELETRLHHGSKVLWGGEAGIICLQNHCCGEWWLQTVVKWDHGQGWWGRWGH